MHGVVPAAGAGTRLRPLTEERPKGLVEVDGRPLLAYVFDTLLDAEVTELVVVIGHLGEKIVAHFGDEYRGRPITYVHQRERLGLGHAVARAEAHVEGSFVVLNGDNVFTGGIEPALDRFGRSGVDAVLLVESVSEAAARETGVLAVDGTRVVDVVEKPADPPSTLITTGCYVLPQSIFDALELLQPSARGEYELSEAVGLLVASGRRVEAVPIPGERVNVNTEADVERAERLFEGATGS